MLTAARWADNSQVFAANISSDSLKFVYLCLITASLILIHSAFINKFQLTTIRFWTDGSCWSTIFASIFLIIDTKKTSIINDAFYIDLCVYAIFGTAVQLADNYMTFTRYLVVYPKITTRFKVFVNLYIWWFMVFTYLPYETIVPCFVDTNSDIVSAANTITAGYIFMIAYLSFNLFFSYKFWIAMQNKNAFSGGGNNKLLILGIKNILHIFISSVGVVLQGIEFTYGFAPAGCFASFFTVNIALHFLFNWKFEKIIYPWKSNLLFRSSSIAIQPHLGCSVVVGKGDLQRRVSSVMLSRQQEDECVIPETLTKTASTKNFSKSFSLFLMASANLKSQLRRNTCQTIDRGNCLVQNNTKDEGRKHNDHDETLSIVPSPSSKPPSSSNLTQSTMSLVISNLFSNKIHNESSLMNLTLPENNNNINNYNYSNLQARFSFLTMSSTPSFKKKDLETSSGRVVKVVKVTARKMSV